MQPHQLHQFRRLGNRAMLLDGGGLSRARSQLEHEISQAREVLFEANTVFPFVLFPDTITIDRVKLTITHRYFFATAQVTGIRIEDILNVAASVGPFFGSVKIWSHVFRDKLMETKHLEIGFLSRRNALEAERILQGYIIARHKKIDTSDTSKDELLDLLRQLGS